MKTDHRPLHPEPVCGSDPFSDADGSVGSSLCAKEQLDGLHRFEGCVPSGTDSPCQSQVSQVHSQREDVAVSRPLLWAVHGASGLHSHDGSSFGVPPLAGRPDASVSGRLADSGVFTGGGLLGKGPCPQIVPAAGCCGKFGRFNLASISTDCVFGNQDRFADFQGFGDSLEDRKVLLNSRRISVLKGAVCEVLEDAARPPHVSDAPLPNGQLHMRALQHGSEARLGFPG